MTSILKIYHSDILVNEISNTGDEAVKTLNNVYYAFVFENSNTKKTKMWKDNAENIKATTQFMSRENEHNDFYYRYEYTFIM